MSTFEKHPSLELVELFNKKPYQGNSPEKTKFIFLSSDANYSHEITNHDFFKYILEYQENGVEFWREYNCHHPFILECYPFNRTKDGVPFHRNFAKLRIESKFANQISFLELLDIPTIGNKSQNHKKFLGLVSEKHLKYLDSLVTCSDNKVIYVSKGVLDDMVKLKKRFNVFEWLDDSLIASASYSTYVNGNQVRKIYHFSSSQIHSQIDEISTFMHNYLKKC